MASLQLRRFLGRIVLPLWSLVAALSLSPVVLLQTSALVWDRSPDIPSHRSFHSSVVLSLPRALGIRAGHIGEPFAVTNRSTAADTPACQCSDAAVLCCAAVHLVFGGDSPAGRLNSIALHLWPLTLMRGGRLSWSFLPVLGTLPAPRRLHAACAGARQPSAGADSSTAAASASSASSLLWSARMLVYGGRDSPRPFFTSLWIFDLRRSRWIPLGPVPPAAVVAQTVENQAARQANRSAVCLDVDVDADYVLPASGPAPAIDSRSNCSWPSGRQGSGMRVFGTRLYLWGGLNWLFEMEQTLWMLELTDPIVEATAQASLQHTCNLLTAPCLPWIKLEPDVTAIASDRWPRARAYFSETSFGSADQYWLIAGGRAAFSVTADTVLSDVWMLHTSTLRWARLTQVQSAFPSSKGRAWPMVMVVQIVQRPINSSTNLCAPDEAARAFLPFLPVTSTGTGFSAACPALPVLFVWKGLEWDGSAAADDDARALPLWEAEAEFAALNASSSNTSIILSSQFRAVNVSQLRGMDALKGRMADSGSTVVEIPSQLIANSSEAMPQQFLLWGGAASAQSLSALTLLDFGQRKVALITAQNSSLMAVADAAVPAWMEDAAASDPPITPAPVLQPTGRALSSAVGVDTGLVLYGGIDANSAVTQDIWSWDAETHLWSQLFDPIAASAAVGPNPSNDTTTCFLCPAPASPLSGFVVAPVAALMLVYAGAVVPPQLPASAPAASVVNASFLWQCQLNATASMPNLWLFELKTQAWTWLTSDQSSLTSVPDPAFAAAADWDWFAVESRPQFLFPRDRDDAAMVALQPVAGSVGNNEGLLLFGGRQLSSAIVSDDLWSFTIESRQWRLLSSQLDPVAADARPAPRYASVASGYRDPLTGASCMLIGFGFSASTEVLVDIWTWCFSGPAGLQQPTGNWSLLSSNSELLNAAGRASSAELTAAFVTSAETGGAGAGRWFLYGTSEAILPGLWIFEMDSGALTQVSPTLFGGASSLAPFRLCPSFVSLPSRSELVLFGGAHDLGVVNELHLLDLDVMPVVASAGQDVLAAIGLNSAFDTEARIDLQRAASSGIVNGDTAGNSSNVLQTHHFRFRFGSLGAAINAMQTRSPGLVTYVLQPPASSAMTGTSDDDSVVLGAQLSLLVITKPCSVLGTGQFVTIDCAGDRCFHINLASAAQPITLHNLRLMHGNSIGNGGSVLAVNSSLLLSNVSIVGSRSAGAGGAIFGSNVRMSLLDCAFDGCVAGTLGGAVSIVASQVSMVATAFRGNAVGADFDENSISPSDQLANQNHVSQLSEMGGGLFSLSSSVVMQNCTFRFNRAWYGGAIASLALSAAVQDAPQLLGSQALLHVDRSEFSSNKALHTGGAIHVAQFTTTTVTDGDVASARVGNDQVMFVSTAFLSNFAGLRGGALFADRCVFTVIGGVWEGNRVPFGSGGAIFFLPDQTDTVLTRPSFASMNATFAQLTARNQAKHGPFMATVPAILRVITDPENRNPLNQSGLPATLLPTSRPRFVVQLEDLYAQRVTVDSQSFVSIHPAQSVAGATVVQLNEGIAQFDALELRVTPTQTVLFSLKSSLSIAAALAVQDDAGAPYDSLHEFVRDTSTLALLSLTSPVCLPGSRVALDSLGCSACPPGSISNVPMASNCSVCQAGKWQSVEGQTQCIDCVPGSASSIQGLTQACPLCARGQYTFESGSSQCLLCNSGVECANGEALARSGRWIFPSLAVSALASNQSALQSGLVYASSQAQLGVSYPCPLSQCIGNGACGALHLQPASDNFLCSQCASGYVSAGISGRCVSCVGSSRGTFAAILLLVFLFVAVLHFGGSEVSGDSQILIYFLQTVSFQAGGLRWWMDWLNVFDFTPSSSSPIACLYPEDRFERLGFDLFAPVVTVSWLTLLVMSQYVLRRTLPASVAMRWYSAKEDALSRLAMFAARTAACCLRQRETKHAPADEPVSPASAGLSAPAPHAGRKFATSASSSSPTSVHRSRAAISLMPAADAVSPPLPSYLDISEHKYASPHALSSPSDAADVIWPLPYADEIEMQSVQISVKGGAGAGTGAGTGRLPPPPPNPPLTPSPLHTQGAMAAMSTGAPPARRQAAVSAATMLAAASTPAESKSAALFPLYVRSLLCLFFMHYQSLCRLILTHLNCVTVGDRVVVFSDSMMDCAADEYARWRVGLWFMVCGWILGIPLVLLVLLCRKPLREFVPSRTRSAVQHPSRGAVHAVSTWHKPLTSGFALVVPWWAIVLLLRRALPVLLDVLLFDRPLDKLLSFVLYDGFLLLAHLYCNPYRNQLQNKIETVSLALIALISVLAMWLLGSAGASSGVDSSSGEVQLPAGLQFLLSLLVLPFCACVICRMLYLQIALRVAKSKVQINSNRQPAHQLRK